MCSLIPALGIFDDTQPLVFPTNFPDEAFWATGETTIVDAARGIDLTDVSALEAAFSGGDPLEGDQISFARIRIRIRIDVPVAGTYVITHPYGVEVFNVDTPGRDYPDQPLHPVRQGTRQPRANRGGHDPCHLPPHSRHGR